MCWVCVVKRTSTFDIVKGKLYWKIIGTTNTIFPIEMDNSVIIHMVE